MLAASVIYLVPDSLAQARTAFAAYDGLEIHGVSDDGGAMVVIFEVADERRLEDLERRLRKHAFVRDIAHHAAHFGATA